MVLHRSRCSAVGDRNNKIPFHGHGTYLVPPREQLSVRILKETTDVSTTKCNADKVE